MKEKPIIIAEACCNHKGIYRLALKMIKSAKKSGANYIKFQKRDIDTWIERKPEIYNKSHPNPKNSFGRTYAEHRQKLEFDFETHKKLKKYCDKVGINYTCSVFDLKSAQQILSLQPKIIKIASSCNNNFELLEYIIKNFKGEIHVSLGMTSKNDIDAIVNLFIQHKKNKDLVLYACTSSYPLNPEDVCLLELKYLKEKYGEIVKGIGFSGHHKGINIDIAAYTLGARYIERHFTLNRKFKGTDQSASLLPKELLNLVNNLTEVSRSLAYKKNDVLKVEYSNKEKLKW